MFRLLIAVCTASLLVGFAASLASASPPQPGNSIVPACIHLVGSHGGTPASAAGHFTVVVRDLANNPLAGAVVRIDLSGCPELHVCSDQLDPTVHVNCIAKTVDGVTAADGSASFTLLGGSNGTGNAVTLQGAGRVFANGSQIGNPTVSAFDLDGENGVGINDLSVWLGDFGTPNNPAFGRSDFDCNHADGINDFSVLLSAFGSLAQTESCTASCP